MNTEGVKHFLAEVMHEAKAPLQALGNLISIGVVALLMAVICIAIASVLYAAITKLGFWLIPVAILLSILASIASGVYATLRNRAQRKQKRAESLAPDSE